MIESNLGMPFVTSDLSVSAAGSFAGQTTTDGLDALGNSIFQKLVSQALTNKSLAGQNGATAENTVLSEASTETDSASTENLLIKLLLGNSNASSLKVQLAGSSASELEESGETTEIDSESMLLEEDSFAAMQAILGGSAGTFLVMNSQNANPELSAEVIEENISALVGLVKSEGNNLKGFLKANRESSGLELMTEQNSLTDSLAQVTDSGETDVLTAKTAGMTEEMETLSQGAVLKNIGNQETTTSGIESLTAASINQAAESARTAEQLARSTAQTAQSAQSSAGNVEALKATTAETETAQNLNQGVAASTDNSKNETEDFSQTLNAAAYQGQTQNTGTMETVQVSPTVQSVEQPEAYSQISKEILAQMEQKYPTEFKMQLQPQDLGTIDISLKLVDGNLVINILAENAKTQALLTGQVDKLIASMGLQNAHVESVTVGQQMNSDSQSSQNQGSQTNSGMNFSQGRQNSQETAESWKQMNSTLFGTQTDVAAENVSSIEPRKDNFYKMNYSI